MNKHRSIAMLWAILYLRDHNLSADPLILMSFVDCYMQSCDMMFDEIAIECGIHAARECGCPILKETITDGAWIDPEDLIE